MPRKLFKVKQPIVAIQSADSAQVGQYIFRETCFHCCVTTPTTNPTRVKDVSLGTKQNLHQDIAKGTLTVAAAGRTPCRSAIAKASQC